MVKNVCPRCRELILSFEDDANLICSKCETEFEIKGDLNDSDNIDKKE